MITWVADKWHAVLEAGGRELRLEADPSTIPGSTAWYWRVIDEGGKVVQDGCRDTVGQAKASCSRAARAYIRNPHGRR